MRHLHCAQGQALPPWPEPCLPKIHPAAAQPPSPPAPGLPKNQPPSRSLATRSPSFSLLLNVPRSLLGCQTPLA